MSYYGDEDNVGYTTHPNGRKVKVTDRGVYEPDTNAYTSDIGYPIFEYDDDGEEIGWDELNERHPDGAYLHEYLWDNTEWI